MASLFKRGKKWCIDYYTPSGRRVRKTVSPYKETAQKALKKVEIEIAEDKYLDVKKRDVISFEAFAKKFLDRHIKRRNKRIRNQIYMLNRLIGQFGKQLMHEITVNDIDEYLIERQQEHASSTVNRDLAMLKSMFNRANEWDDLNGYNPARDIRLLNEDNERCRYLSEEEEDRLLSECSGPLRLIVLIALRAGLRWGEIVNLKWNQAPKSNYINFKHNTIFIHESLAKSKKSRYVPLAASVKQALMDYPQKNEQGYIFVSSKTGKPIVTLKKSFHSVLKRAGIEDFRFHDIRHCFASDLVRKGIDLFVVQKLLGHSSPKMTQRYAHLGHDHLSEAINLLDEKEEKSFDFGHNLDTSKSAISV